MLTFSALGVLGLALPFYVHYWGLAIGTLHSLVVTLVHVLLTEILLLRFRKIPFTCPYPPFRDSAILSVLMCIFGFITYTVLISNLEHWMLAGLSRVFLLLPLSALVWYGVRKIRQGITAEQEPLTFEDLPTTFELLKLSDGN